MICGNCGYQNQPGDEFCGSCGQFLAWNETPAEAGQAGTGSAAAPTPDVPAVPIPPPPNAADAPTTIVPPPPPPPSTAPDSTIAPTGASGAYWPAGIQRCNVCGTANELTRTFCLNCGSQLPKAGTTSGLAAAASGAGSGRSFRTPLYALGGAFVLLVAVAIAFVGLGGLNGPRPVANGSPTTGPTLAALASAGGALPTPSTTLGIATLSPESLPPASPPAESPVATEAPTTPAPSTPGPATPGPSAAAGLSCANQHLDAAAPGEWSITRLSSSHQGATDLLAIDVAPGAPSTAAAGVDAALMAPDQVLQTFGVPGPTTGDIALVLSFNDAVVSKGQYVLDVGYKALQEAAVARHSGLAYVVLGINGAGCYSLTSDGWSSGSTSPTQLIVTIQH